MVATIHYNPCQALVHLVAVHEAGQHRVRGAHRVEDVDPVVDVAPDLAVHALLDAVAFDTVLVGGLGLLPTAALQAPFLEGGQAVFRIVREEVRRVPVGLPGHVAGGVVFVLRLAGLAGLGEEEAVVRIVGVADVAPVPLASLGPVADLVVAEGLLRPVPVADGSQAVEVVSNFSVVCQIPEVTFARCRRPLSVHITGPL